MFHTRGHFLILAEAGKPDGRSLRVADVVELLVVRLIQDVVDGGGEIVLSHVIPAEDRGGPGWSRWWNRWFGMVQDEGNGGTDGSGWFEMKKMEQMVRDGSR